MMFYSHKITIIRLKKLKQANINQELQWLGSSLGLFSLRDKDKSCFRLFIELLKSAKKKEKLSSDELAARLDLTRGTVIHHLNKLMDSGIIIKDKNRYLLRVDSMQELIKEIRKDIKRTVDDLEEMACLVDKTLGF